MRQYERAREPSRQHAEAKACLIMLAHEGPAALVEAERAAVAAMAAEAGIATAPGEIVERWFAHRNTVPSWDALLARGLVVDTVEVSAEWTRIGDVYDEAVASLKQIEGLIAGSAHSSHVYRSGLNLYFTFAVQTSAPEQMEAAYLEGWRRIMEATARHGGSVAHHHGIGRVRRDWLATELGENGVALLRRVKGALDPDTDHADPGVLLPDA